MTSTLGGLVVAETPGAHAPGPPNRGQGRRIRAGSTACAARPKRASTHPKSEVTLDYRAVCLSAIAPLARRGPFPYYVERDDLMSEGYLAIAKSGTPDEALAVVIARHAMIDYIQAARIRERGRVDVPGDADDVDDETLSDGDKWEALIYRNVSARPEGMDTYLLWEAVEEAVQSLPLELYRVVRLTFWGGMTQAEVARMVGVSRRTVSTRLASAKEHLRTWPGLAARGGNAKRLPT